MQWDEWAVGVCYIRIRRKGSTDDCALGFNKYHGDWVIICNISVSFMLKKKSQSLLPLE